MLKNPYLSGKLETKWCFIPLGAHWWSCRGMAGMETAIKCRRCVSERCKSHLWRQKIYLSNRRKYHCPRKWWTLVERIYWRIVGKLYFQVQLSFCFALYMKGGEKVESISQISSLVKEYIMPETVWLVPCLYALGSIIKRSIRIDDTLIPVSYTHLFRSMRQSFPWLARQPSTEKRPSAEIWLFPERFRQQIFKEVDAWLEVMQESALRFQKIRCKPFRKWVGKLPVSYTHLDVYKRQPQPFYRSCSFDCIL